MPSPSRWGRLAGTAARRISASAGARVRYRLNPSVVCSVVCIRQCAPLRANARRPEDQSLVQPGYDPKAVSDLRAGLFFERPGFVVRLQTPIRPLRRTKKVSPRPGSKQKGNLLDL